jgi:ribonuclease P protein component
MPERFQRSDRVQKQADFDRAYQARVFAADDVLIINGVPNELPHARLGLSIGKVVGNAVVRNRWKRLIREAFRLSRGDLPPGLDLVVRPQRGAVADFDAVCRSLVAVARRVAKRLQAPPPKAQSMENHQSRRRPPSRKRGK